MRRRCLAALASVAAVGLAAKPSLAADSGQGVVALSATVAEYETVTPASIDVQMVVTGKPNGGKITLTGTGSLTVSANTGLTLALTAPQTIRLTGQGNAAKVLLSGTSGSPAQYALVSSSLNQTQTLYMRGLSAGSSYGINVVLKVVGAGSFNGTYTGSATLTIQPGDWPGTAP